MQIRIFSIPITDNGEMQAEMNRFLSASKVLEIEQRFYQNDKSAFWSFCVRYLNGNTGSFQQQSTKQEAIVLIRLQKYDEAKSSLIKYRELLDKENSNLEKINNQREWSLIKNYIDKEYEWTQKMINKVSKL